MVKRRWYWPKLHNLEVFEAKITEQPVLSTGPKYDTAVWCAALILLFLLYTCTFFSWIKITIHLIIWYKMKIRNKIFQFELKIKCNFNWMVTFMPVSFKVGSWKCKCLKRPFSETQGLSLLSFCVLKKSRDQGGKLQFSPPTESHIFKWKAFHNRGAIMYLEKAVCPLASDISYR